jgi:hypothetical protein
MRIVVVTMEALINDITGYDAERSSQLINLFGWVIVTWMLSIPIIGLAIEYLDYSPIIYAIIASGCLWSLCLLVHSTAALVLAFVFFGMYRALLYAFAFSFIHDVSGAGYYGIMLGSLMMVSGFASLLQYPLASWTKGSCFDINETQELCAQGHWSAAYALIGLLMVASIRFVVEIQDVKKKHLEMLSASAIDISIDRKSYGSLSVQE